MRPEQNSQYWLSSTQLEAKMLEYGIPKGLDSPRRVDPAHLFPLSIGLLGDFASAINREEPYLDHHSKLRSNLLFSARFFDSYLQSKLNETPDPYFVILGSASYYLCDLPGSASVLAKWINGDCPDLGGDRLEKLLLWFLQGNFRTNFDGSEGLFGRIIDEISKGILRFFEAGKGEGNLLELATELRESVYDFGTPRQLLFGDVIAAVLRKKLENSVWKALP